MKKLLRILAAVIALSSILAACAPATQAPAAQTPGADVSASPKAEGPAAVTPIADAEEPSAAPLEGELQQELEAMMPILDSIVLAMEIGDAASYAPRDEEFFWSVLYLMANNWGMTHPLVEIDADETVARSMVMQEFASAAFIDYDDLLPIPEILQEAVRYDQSNDTYRFAMSDAGESYTSLLSGVPTDNSAVAVKVGLYDGAADELMATVNFMLLPNPYADGVSDPLYLYSVSAVTLE